MKHNRPTSPGLLNPPRVIRSPWRYKDGRPEIGGIRIYQGERFIFIRDEHLLALANSIADYLTEESNHR